MGSPPQLHKATGALMFFVLFSAPACSYRVCTRWDTFALQPTIPHCEDAPTSYTVPTHLASYDR
jgi:hypothetical protein